MHHLKYTMIGLSLMALCTSCSSSSIYEPIGHEGYAQTTIEVNETISTNNQTIFDFYNEIIVHPKVKKYIEDAPLTSIEGITERIDHKNVFSDKMIFTFYQYINDKKEGGNIKYVSVSFDPQTQEIVSLEYMAGSGKALVNDVDSNHLDQISHVSKDALSLDANDIDHLVEQLTNISGLKIEFSIQGLKSDTGMKDTLRCDSNDVVLEEPFVNIWHYHNGWSSK